MSSAAVVIGALGRVYAIWHAAVASKYVNP